MEGEGLPDRPDDGQRRQERARLLGGLAGVFGVVFAGLLALTVHLSTSGSRAALPTEVQTVTASVTALPSASVVSNFGFSITPGATETGTIQAASRTPGAGPRTVFVTVTQTVTRAPGAAVQSAGNPSPMAAPAAAATTAQTARPAATTTVTEPAAAAPSSGSGTSPWSNVASLGTGCSGFAALGLATAALLGLRKRGGGSS